VQIGSDEPPSNVNVESAETDLIPQSYMFAYLVQKHVAERPLFVLFDPGSKSSFINKRAIPMGATPQLTHNAGSTITAAGTFPNNLSVVLRDLVFPEFSSSLVVERHGFLVFDQPDVPYDVILGRDFLIPTEFDISYSNKMMTWHRRMVALKPPDTQVFYLSDDDDNDAFITEIKPSKYEKVDINFVVEQQKHLSSEQQKQLLEALKGHEILFDGKLCTYPGKKIHLNLKADVAPIHCKPFPIPKLHEKVFRDECKRLCEEGVLEPCGATEHAYPTFIIPKKDGHV
jgi:hypothetical protein